MRTVFLAALLAIAAAIHGSVSTAQDSTGFLDEFVGTDLNPAFRTLNPDPQFFAMLGDALLLVTNGENKNIVEYTGALPADYSVTIRVSEPPQIFGQAVRIRVGTLSDNVRTGLSMIEDAWGLQNVFFTQKTLEDQDSERIDLKDNDMGGKPVYLRMEKTGPIYEGFYSPDGAKWTSLGRQVFTTPGARISLEAVNWRDAPESPVQIDSFEIMEVLR